ncbi:MAG: hypothetical protein B7Y98_08995 [Sphingomonas sp. 32-62-10]|nr:MAG: hypothetical protein B7Z43_09135 [Sphingomonas sp. 12-62-6]OYX38348.1 MAG: hypothetical protein B7Y98_08995 [Sphingomonas sp. 32-62-10]
MLRCKKSSAGASWRKSRSQLPFGLSEVEAQAQAQAQAQALRMPFDFAQGERGRENWGTIPQRRF